MPCRKVAQKTNPKLWKKVVAEVKRGSKGGKPNKWSAFKSLLAGKKYRSRGGGYKNKKCSNNSLRKWVKQDWGYVGKPKKSRFLPHKGNFLTRGQKAATSRAKRKGTKNGKQYVPQPESIRKITRRYTR